MSQPRPKDPTLGECMRRDRQYAGKTLKEAAAYLLISVPYLSDLERDKRGPLEAEQLIRLAAYYGVPSNEWLDASVEDPTAAMIRDLRAELAISKHQLAICDETIAAGRATLLASQDVAQMAALMHANTALEAENGRLRALVPGVEEKWTEASGFLLRGYLPGRHTALQISTFSNRWEVFGPVRGELLRSGTSSSKEAAMADAEAAGRECGVIRG